MKLLTPVLLSLCFAGAAVAQTPTMPAMPSAPGGAALPQMPGGPQGQGDMAQMMKMMQQGAHNQLGVLEYCQAQGSVGQDVVDLQKRMVSMLPPAPGVEGLDEAEATGKRGVVQFGGQQVQLADAAKAQSTTPDAMCKKIGDMLKMQAANLPK